MILKKRKSAKKKPIVVKSTKVQPAAKKENDFGGIPDVDPKKFLGCG